MTELQQLLEQQLEMAEPDLARVAEAWALEHARSLLAEAKQRRERRQLLDEAEDELSQLLDEQREAHAKLRLAISAHEDVLQRRQALWNQRVAPADPVAHRRELAELDSLECKLRAERELCASAYDRLTARVARARRELERVRAGEAESALR